VRQCEVIGKFLSASFKGKDLLEATGNHSKASLEFKDLMEKLSNEPYAENTEAIRKEVFSFAFFIYGEDKRAEFFTDKIMFELQ
jgi:hypothetical protein